jgi:hypothetical protein
MGVPANINELISGTTREMTADGPIRSTLFRPYDKCIVRPPIHNCFRRPCRIDARLTKRNRSNTFKPIAEYEFSVILSNTYLFPSVIAISYYETWSISFSLQSNGWLKLVIEWENGDIG